MEYFKNLSKVEQPWGVVNQTSSSGLAQCPLETAWLPVGPVQWLTPGGGAEAWCAGRFLVL